MRQNNAKRVKFESILNTKYVDVPTVTITKLPRRKISYVHDLNIGLNNIIHVYHFKTQYLVTRKISINIKKAQVATKSEKMPSCRSCDP